eukprot:262463-Chlamydomonas_euryale.AAC.1
MHIRTTVQQSHTAEGSNSFQPPRGGGSMARMTTRSKARAGCGQVVWTQGVDTTCGDSLDGATAAQLHTRGASVLHHNLLHMRIGPHLAGRPLGHTSARGACPGSEHSCHNPSQPYPTLVNPAQVPSRASHDNA